MRLTNTTIILELNIYELEKIIDFARYYPQTLTAYEKQGLDAMTDIEKKVRDFLLNLENIIKD